MPRPKNKEELLSQSQQGYEKLLKLIDGLSEEEQLGDFQEGTLNRNIRDVLCHLYAWHKMVMGWYNEGLAGRKPEIPAKGYTWRTTPALNLKIRDEYADTTLEKARALFEGSHKDHQALISSKSEEELFEKKRYKWTGSTSLAAYLISSSSSHYDWALKLIKRCLKQKKAMA